MEVENSSEELNQELTDEAGPSVLNWVRKPSMVVLARAEGLRRLASGTCSDLRSISTTCTCIKTYHRAGDSNFVPRYDLICGEKIPA